MIWLLIVALALVVLLVLTMGFRGARGGWEAIASALVLGLAGYALQGHPGQPGAPHDAADKPNIFAATLVDERRKVVGATVQGSKWEMIADALMRHGDYADAAEVLRGAVDKDPRDSAAWLAMASALVGHAEGSLSPASLYAFRQAAKADPQAPGPAMFLGLALAGSGRFDEAHDMWATLLAKAPADAPWRKDLVARMARLDQIIAMTRAAQGARWAPLNPPSRLAESSWLPIARHAANRRAAAQATTPLQAIRGLGRMNASATPAQSDPCLASQDAGEISNEHSHHLHGALPKLALGALGVVFGDIGTSPLYAIQAIMTGEHPLPIDLLNIYGVISLIFWTMVTVVTLKYVLLVLRLDNNGEGARWPCWR
jgi:cytochrome c-type biogenesis protein CcmH